VPFVKVARVSEVPENSVIEVRVDGRPYAVCNADGRITALDGVCPHAGGPLGEGRVADGRVTCPFHLWEFNCLTGENDFDPATRVSTFPVKVEGEDIFIETA
jgi:nitrite reductase/ring-hydroxylating ferredoxin subunit